MSLLITSYWVRVVTRLKVNSVLYIVPICSYPLVDSKLLNSGGLVDDILGNNLFIAVSSYNIIVARTHSYNSNIPEGCGSAAQLMDAELVVVVPFIKAIIAVIGLWTVGIWNFLFNLLNKQPLQLILRRLLIINQMMQSGTCIRPSD